MKNKINLFNNRVALIEPSGGFSGMQYYNMGMFEGLKTNGVSPFLFTSSSEKFLNSNIENIYNYFDKVWKSPYFITKFYFYIIGLIKSIIIAKKEKCHIVHLHQFHLDSNLILTIIFCKIFFNRLVLTVHDVDSFQKKKKGINIIFAFVVNFSLFVLFTGVVGGVAAAGVIGYVAYTKVFAKGASILSNKA